MAAKYKKTAFDDGRYQLTGGVQNGAKFPAALVMGTKVDEYKGYTNTFVCFKVRTNVEGDVNHGWITAELNIPHAYEVFAYLKDIKHDSPKMTWEVSNFVFGKDRKRSEEPHVTATVTVWVKDDFVHIAVVDARDTRRPKIAFKFGHNPRPRYPNTRTSSEDKFMVSKMAAGAYADAILALLPAAINGAIADKLAGIEDTTRDAPTSTSHDVDINDDMPF